MVMFCYMGCRIRPSVFSNACRTQQPITRTPKRDHITPVLRKLHWLPVEKRLLYKVLLYTYKALHGLSPSYVCDLIVPYKPTRSLRSEKKSMLHVPKTRTVGYGDRSFSKSSPVLWNELPETIKCSGSIEIFKRRLKTHLSYVYSYV